MGNYLATTQKKLTRPQRIWAMTLASFLPRGQEIFSFPLSHKRIRRELFLVDCIIVPTTLSLGLDMWCNLANGMWVDMMYAISEHHTFPSSLLLVLSAIKTCMSQIGTSPSVWILNGNTWTCHSMPAGTNTWDEQEINVCYCNLEIFGIAYLTAKQTNTLAFSCEKRDLRIA